jgi:hypothetical protein
MARVCMCAGAEAPPWPCQIAGLLFLPTLQTQRCPQCMGDEPKGTPYHPGLGWGWVGQPRLKWLKISTLEKV